ncbi:related to Protein-tyrosine phosphatase gamma precursor [Melanopsichium pennsylvanicum]|uniref:Related to Protein-tyrosine phosphatase gamma n=2 Tax=Melanopsichium pennsylvanicum TaxID=63383 RepID=A0AAJ4XS31_9BASI|nr:related to Protein-tyrosine phosphatase gamma precursor [Melanopsichium pennsylvanicum 4]SNX86832.1 related to Protein-tyrosine phosphatase gamma precursor [Melanopsichium pennsylvanicum]
MSLGLRPSKIALNQLYSALDFIDHLRLSQSHLGYTTTLSTSSENIHANRYRDILPYDHALLPGPFLNAAFIPFFHPTALSFIISQAPLPQTFTNFYTHIVQQRVKLLINLTTLVENGRLKAHQYWPDPSSPSESSSNQIVLDNGWKVTMDSETTIDLAQGQATLIRRVIHIDTTNTASSCCSSTSKDLKTGWSFTQFHVTSWPDHGVFPTCLLLQLMEQTQQVVIPKNDPPPPTWIHCSAGVGRSGTLAAAFIAEATINVVKDSAQNDDALDEKVNMWMIGRNVTSQVWDLPVRIVEHLRRYRARMVQTIEQFEAVFEIVAQLATKAEMVPK